MPVVVSDQRDFGHSLVLDGDQYQASVSCSGVGPVARDEVSYNCSQGGSCELQII